MDVARKTRDFNIEELALIDPEAPHFPRQFNQGEQLRCQKTISSNGFTEIKAQLFVNRETCWLALL